MPRLPVYLPGWESGWKPGSSGGDSGGRSYSWKHCLLREGTEPSSWGKVFLYIMYFFTFGGFFLYNFNKDCKQRLRLCCFFFLNIGWICALEHSGFCVMAKGTFFPVLLLTSVFEVLIQIPVWCGGDEVRCGCGPFVFQWCYSVSMLNTWLNPAVLQSFSSAVPGRGYRNKTRWRSCSLVLILFNGLWLWADNSL